MDMSYLDDVIRRLEEIAEMKELNLKLTQTLEDTLLSVINYAERKSIPLHDMEDVSYLLEQVQILMKKTKNFSSSFLQHRKPSDDSYHDDETDDKLPVPQSRRFIICLLLIRVFIIKTNKGSDK
jgi:hypothetical protein